MIINDRYEYNPQKDLLGQGGFGKVYKAKDILNDRIVALKFVEKDKFSNKYNLEGEFQKASTFDHPNLIRYFDGFDYELSNSIGQKSMLHVAAMEYANAGNLKEYDKRKLTFQQKGKIIEEILSALQYLHERNIVHRDIKPANVLLSKDWDGKLTVKLSDFGISKQLKSEYSTISNVLGTTEYMSPEQLGLTPDGKIGKSADLWSMGILIYDMFLGETPFGKSSDGVSQSKILNGILNFKKAPRLSEIPEPYQKMVSRCLVLDPKKRVQSAKVLANFMKPKKTPTKRAAVKTDWKKMAIGAFALAGILGLFLIGSLISGGKSGDYGSAADRNLIRSLKIENAKLRDELATRSSSTTGAGYVYLSADKMNVLYIGVENPITLNTEGVNAGSLTVSSVGAGSKIKPRGSGSYVLSVTKPGECKIMVEGDGINYSKTYRVKRLPDPIARVSKSAGGSMGSGEFKAQGGVGAYLDAFDFDAKCQIQGYSLVYIAKRQDPVESVNPGARYNDKSRRLIQRAKPGDTYFFDNVKARCPGDRAGRRINTMVYRIK